MPFTVNCYSCAAVNAPLLPAEVERRDLLDDDVLIEIIYTGICHSDVHRGVDQWGNTKYPVVPGHEIVGRVAKVGSKVTEHKVGDIVAVGCLVDSCRNCSPCKSGEEIFCENGCTVTYNTPERRFPGRITAGGYSEQIVVPEHFALRVPKSLQSKDLLPGVAPILCAGITMYSPMREYNLQPGQRIGIVGLGGLGLMGVRLAKAIGAEVVVISRSHKKDEEAKELGADKVIASGSENELQENASSLDLIIDTIPFDHDIDVYTPLLKLHKTIVVVGHIGLFAKAPVSTGPLIFGNRKLAGSAIGGIKQTQELLEFCGKHKITADHKVVKMQDVNEAWKNIGNQAIRFVINVDEYRKANSSH